MFVLKRNFVCITKLAKHVIKNAKIVNIYRSNLFQQVVSVELTAFRTFSSDPQNTNDLATEQEGKSPTMDYDAITKGDKELEHKLKVIMLETEVLRQEGFPIPPDDFLTPEMWQELLNLPSRSGRKRYLQYLFKISKKQENRQVKKKEKQKAFEEYKNTTKPGIHTSLPIEEHASVYKLLHNNIFLRFYETTMNQMYNNRLMQAMQFSQKLVIDCGYDQNMTSRENYNCAKQLMLLFAENRTSDQPFDLHFTNMNKEDVMAKVLHKLIPTMYDVEFPMNIHEKSYLDLFPRDKLVYLTPHCRDVMDKFDHEAVYIIGAMVDKVNNEPLSLAKAKREGLKMAKFPLDKHLQWAPGSGKSLALNQCLLILLDLKTTGDWNYALRHVPKRKLSDSNTPQNIKKYTKESKFDGRMRTSWKPKAKRNINMRDVFYE